MHYRNSDHCSTLNSLVVLMYKYLKANGANPKLPGRIGHKWPTPVRDVRLRTFVVRQKTSVGVVYDDGYVESFPKPTRSGRVPSSEEMAQYSSAENPRFNESPFEYNHILVEFVFGDTVENSVFIDLLPLSRDNTLIFRHRKKSIDMVYRMLRAHCKGHIYSGHKGMYVDVDLITLGEQGCHVEEYVSMKVTPCSVHPKAVPCDLDSIKANGDALLKALCKPLKQKKICITAMPKSLSCARCKEATYCSKECQKKD